MTSLHNDGPVVIFRVWLRHIEMDNLQFADMYSTFYPVMRPAQEEARADPQEPVPTHYRRRCYICDYICVRAPFSTVIGMLFIGRRSRKRTVFA